MLKDRTDRLKLLFAMFELNLKRELTREERHMLSLSDLYLGDPDPAAGDDEDIAFDRFGS
jgi:hypothetical protein